MNAEEKIRVLIVDDQELFTKGLAGLIDMESDMEAVGQPHDGEQAVALCVEKEPDVILMDIVVENPRMKGVRAAHRTEGALHMCPDSHR